jgi:hypothetical protein
MNENQDLPLVEEVLADDYPNYDLSFKIILIGDAGKSF